MPEFIKYLLDNSCIASSPAFQAKPEKTIFVAENKIEITAVSGGQYLKYFFDCVLSFLTVD